MIEKEPKGLLGVSFCGSAEKWQYYIAVASDEPIEEGLCETMIPAATWVIFKGEGTNLSIQELEKQIVTDWLPTSGYEYADAPDVEVYFNVDPNHAIYEGWVPGVKKN